MNLSLFDAYHYGESNELCFVSLRSLDGELLRFNVQKKVRPLTFDTPLYVMNFTFELTMNTCSCNHYLNEMIESQVFLPKALLLVLSSNYIFLLQSSHHTHPSY